MHSRRYSAFISYRHADNKQMGRKWANWLHEALESYEVPPDLIGTTNQRGDQVPASLYPVFRDEEELPADADLSTNIRRALENSGLLVVLCSPRAVQSRFVADEIRYFKELGHSHRILALMIDGEPNASDDPSKLDTFGPDAECFPEPLRFGVASEVNPRDIDWTVRTEPIAADVRPEGRCEQGWTAAAAYHEQLQQEGKLTPGQCSAAVRDYTARIELAKLKIIAGALAVPLGVLTNRDKAQQLARARRRARTLHLIIGIVSVLLVIAIATGLWAVRQRQLADEQREAAVAARQQSEKQKRESDGLVAVISLAEKDAVKALKTEAPGLAQNLDDRLALYLKAYGVPGDLSAFEASAFQQLVDKAGELHSQGQSAAAIAIAARILSEILPSEEHARLPADLDKVSARARMVLGKALQDGGLMVDKDGREIRKSMFWQEAFKAFAQARKSLEGIVAASPGETDEVEMLAESITRMGDVHHMSGAMAEALNYYREALEFCKQHSEGRMGDRSWQMRLAESHLHVGHITGSDLTDKASITEAKQHFAACSEIVKPLLEADAKDVPALTLEVGVEGAMAVLYSEDDLPTAINFASQAADHLRTLVSLQPGNTPAKRELSVGLWRLAGLLMQQEPSDTRRAIATVEEGLGVLSEMEKEHSLIPFELRMRQWLEQQLATLEESQTR